MNKIIKFKIPVFREYILVCISSNIKTLKKLFPKEKLNKYNKTNLGLAFSAMDKNKKYKRVIWLRRWDIPIFIHEVYHIVKYIIDDKSIEDHETGAYISEFIFQKTLNKIKRR